MRGIGNLLFRLLVVAGVAVGLFYLFLFLTR